jgi:TrmH family RNA methyltransferase
MLSKAKIKYIKSLQVKKYRKEEQCFLVEGAKSVSEVLASDFEVVLLVATRNYLQHQPVPKSIECIEATDTELAALGEYATNNAAIAVVKMKANTPFAVGHSEFALALDDIRDPGNLGTIVRTADWYGIHKIIASEETAEVYNPKVIAASMGSFCRVKIFYTSLPSYLASANVPVLGAFLEGVNVHTFEFGQAGILVIGNEARGISDVVAACVTQRITIPKYGRAESLNAAIATAVICDNLQRGKR